MINKINTLRTVANNLSSHIFMEGKTVIKKPGAIIPGAVTVAGVVVTIETKDNNANLIVQKDNKEIQNAAFNYNETPDGYELISARSSYFYDDKDNKEIRQNHYLIEPETEKAQEYSVKYTNAPVKENLRTYIDQINSSVAQAAGYKSNKTEYDSQESHTYGKKSLQRDIPALLKLLDVIAPNAEFTLKMKDKLKKDNKTSLVAFEVNSTENGKEIVKGFMSANGDSVSYHIDTEDMTIIGEQTLNKDSSRTYLKPEQTVPDVKVDVTPKGKNEKGTGEKTQANNDKAGKIKPEAEAEKEKDSKQPAKTVTTEKAKKGIKKDENQETTEKAAATVEPVATTNSTHAHSIEYYTNLIREAAADKSSRGEKAKKYKKILSMAYLDGFNKTELENILLADGLPSFSYYCKKTYVEGGIELAKSGETEQVQVNTSENKIKELQNITIETEDEDINRCIHNMINDCINIQDAEVKENFVDKALSILKNNSSKDIKADLLLFMQESAQINDDLRLHYEIYEEFVDNKKTAALKSHIEQMINNISDADYPEKRGEFLTQLYVAKNRNELETLKSEVQKLLDEQFTKKETKETPSKKLPKKQSKKLLIESLSGANQKLVKKLLACRSPKNMSLSFDEIVNLLEDIGFEESNVSGTHHKFRPPLEIYFNGEKQSFITVAYQKTKAPNPAQIDDLINVCKQYYGKEKK